MPVGQRLVEKTKKLSIANKRIRELEKDYMILDEKYNAVVITNEEWATRFKLLQQGGVMYCTDQDGYVTEVIKFPAYHETTFDQDIPEDISRGYYKVVDGNIERDEEKYKKYIRRVIL